MVAKKPKKSVSPRITAEQRRDWRNLSIGHWNTITITEYFRDMNEDHYGLPAAEYLPMRNWSAESGMIKRALTEHGSEVLRRAFDECFHTYKPTREYPYLTAGFAVSYLINRMVPKIKADLTAEAVTESKPDYEAVNTWF
ncbi:hypothetical protein [Paenibacillus pinihumi]|uniref:hypothetical protein n=1 Tax=Paenibacillus pinihumi TaxID=669462 RepID=UPI0004239731|nr:hypothetical protein [Paenibacillus pinihumi]